MVDLNPLGKGGVFFYFLEVWKLLSPYKLLPALSICDIIREPQGFAEDLSGEARAEMSPKENLSAVSVAHHPWKRSKKVVLEEILEAQSGTEGNQIIYEGKL